MIGVLVCPRSQHSHYKFPFSVTLCIARSKRGYREECILITIDMFACLDDGVRKGAKELQNRLYVGAGGGIALRSNFDEKLSLCFAVESLAIVLWVCRKEYKELCVLWRQCGCG